MATIKTLIIEDEKPARDLLKNYINDFPQLSIEGEYADGFSGLKAINEIKPDLIFLDIQMPKLSGFELLELLDQPPLIIFTTAYDEFAIKAFDMNAVDYLLKPFSRKRFSKAINRAIQIIEQPSEKKNESIQKLVESVNNSVETIERIVVKSGSRINVIDVNHIFYLQAEDDYVMIHTKEDQFLKQNTLSYYEEHLSKNDFIRIHRSTIVRLDQITMINNYGKESYVVSLKSGNELKVSKSRIKELKEKLDF